MSTALDALILRRVDADAGHWLTVRLLQSMLPMYRPDDVATAVDRLAEQQMLRRRGGSSDAAQVGVQVCATSPVLGATAC